MTNANTQQQQTNPAAQNITTSYTASQEQNPQSAQTQTTAQMQSAAPNAAQQNVMQNAAGTQPKAVVGIFRDLSVAKECVAQLRSSGFTTEEINLVSKDPAPKTSYEDDSIMDGAMTGGAIGGLGGLLLSAGALTIPGLGPIIAAGPLAATITGAISGGVTGGLVDWGIPAEKSEEYSDEISSGNTLAVIKAAESKVAQAVQILTANGAMNIETHAVK